MATVAAPTPFVAHDPHFADVLGDTPRIVKVIDGDAHEGPVYVADEDALYFTTLPRPGVPVSIKRIALDGERFPLEGERVTTVREDANRANGMTIAEDGWLVVCEQGSFAQPARITRFDPKTGDVETLADSWHGLPLSSPNDVVVARDGAIWFTDPSYGHLQGFRPEPRTDDAVYRIGTTGRVDRVATGFDKPNGLAFSPDERALYVADNGGPHHLLAFAVAGDKLAAPVRIAGGTPEHPDGLKVDAAGRIYASTTTGVRVHDPSGELVGEIRLPGAVNFCFGGPEQNVLFITRDTAVWAAVLNAKGA